MLIDYTRGQTGVILRVKMQTTSGLGQTGISSASAGLVISTIADVEAAPVAYTQAGGTIGAVATLGTYAAPSANQCNIKAVSDADHPGIVEIHLADARYAVANAKSLLVSWSGVSGMADGDALVPLRAVNPYDAVRMGLTAIPNVAQGTPGALSTLTAAQAASAVMADVTDTVGADVVAIKAQTDKLAFDGSDNVKSAAQTLPNPAPSGYGGSGGSGISLPSGTVGANPTSTSFAATMSGLGSGIKTGDLSGRRILLTSGTLAGYLTEIGCQTAVINGTTATFTFASALRETPAQGDTFQVAGY